ncbi:MAG: undecaprenyl-diphosphate phosphatase [Planctomycetota bacterium]
MELIQIIVLALVQGLTEFLPISSSAHLVLTPRVFGWSDQGLAFDVAVHVGTLVAVVFYFRSDLISVAKAWVRSLSTRQQTTESRLAWGLVVATIPICVGALLLGDALKQLRSLEVIAATTIIFGILLWGSDKFGRGERTSEDVGWKDMIWIGIAQAFAIIPGTSRSGSTITAGLFLKLNRTTAARISFLLSVPTIGLAGGHQLMELLGEAEPIDWSAIGIGAALSTLSAYACIRLFLGFVEKVGVMPFVLYRFALGAALIYFVCAEYNPPT